MKKFWCEFGKRGLLAAAGGPVVLAIVYGILGATGEVSSLTPREVCMGILTVTLLAFIVAGSGAVYTVEKLPLMYAALIQGGILYADYILIYLLNGWLQSQILSVLIFTGVFVVGYGLIWLIIYCTIKAKTDRVNKMLHG